MNQLVILQGYLVEAELALHQLLTGKHATSVSYEGKSVTYTATNLSELRAYIAMLRQQIGTLNGTLPRRGPLHLTF